MSSEVDPRVIPAYETPPLMPQQPPTLCPRGTFWEFDEDTREWNCVTAHPHATIDPKVGIVGWDPLPPWREVPFGRVVRFLGERPKAPYPKHERCSVGIGVTEAWDEDAKDGTTALQVFSRVTGKSAVVIVPHCYRGLRPCWCWPDEVEGFKVQRDQA